MKQHLTETQEHNFEIDNIVVQVINEVGNNDKYIIDYIKGKLNIYEIIVLRC